MENEIVIFDKSPIGMLQLASQNGIDIDKMERMLELQIRYEENEARKAYHKAMAAFKSNPPEIDKDRHVGYESRKTGDKTSYSHASLYNVCDKINRAMSPHGLTAAWKVDQGDKNMVSVTCTITHELGHSESTTLTAAPDASGSKNSIQAIGSTTTYLERYTILALTGLATKDQDNDGVIPENDFVSGEDLETIKDLVKKYVKFEKSFMKYVGADSIDAIPVSSLQKAMGFLNQKRVDASKREPGSEG